MNEPEKIDLRSMDIVKEQKEKLRQLFPEVFTEDKVDFEKLKLTLGESIEVGKERYGMNWPGKADCFKIIQNPSIGTLKLCPEESVNFDNTENLFIEGDNLEVLKLLQKSYYGKVKMIYIDPPYNTGNDFIYPDDYTENLTTYLQYTGQVDAEGKKFSTNTDTEGRFHSKWLNMMYPRLFLAKNLLRDDGVIFISIDDTEVDNLKKICNEIFGEENFISQLIRQTIEGGKQDSQTVQRTHEYCLVYTKSDIRGINRKKIEDFGHYTKEDKYLKERGKYYLKPLENGGLGYVSSLDYSIIGPDNREIYPGGCHGDNGYRWVWSKERVEKAKKLELIEFVRSRSGEDYKVYYKIYQYFNSEGKKIERLTPFKTLYLDGFTNRQGVLQLKSLFKNLRLYDYPKPTSFLKELLLMGSDEDSIILDFFAGSASTAHAVLDLNKEEGGNRKFIMVQLPEICDENSEAHKAGFKTIADIGKERIRRVIKNIKKEKEKTLFKNKKLDLGFKVFKLNKSNFKIWDGENIPKDKNSLEKQLEFHINHIDPKSTQEDILLEILLKAGFELTTKIEKIKLAGKTVYSIEDGAMLVCLEKELTKEMIKAMAEKQPSRVICLDQGFINNDQLKTNAVQIMKTKGVDDFRTV